MPCVPMQCHCTMVVPKQCQVQYRTCSDIALWLCQSAMPGAISYTSYCTMLVQSASNLLNRYRGSDTNLYQRNLEAQALMAQQQALGMGIQGLSSQTALDLLQVGLDTCCQPVTAASLTVTSHCVQHCCTQGCAIQAALSAMALASYQKAGKPLCNLLCAAASAVSRLAVFVADHMNMCHI